MRDPARELEFRRLETYVEAVFGVEPRLEHVKLKRADHADQCRRAVERAEHLHHALLRHLLQRFLQLLGLHRIAELHAAQNFRREVRHAEKFELLALRERIADTQRAVVGNADDVAGKSLVGHRAILREEKLRRRQCHRLAGAHQLGLHAAAQLARTQPRKGDAVAVIGIHVGLDLEHEGGHAILVRHDLARAGGLRPRRRRETRERIEQILDAEILDRRAEIDRRQMPFAERGKFERAAGVFHQRQFLRDRLDVEHGILGVQRRQIERLRHRRAAVVIQEPHVARGEFIGADEIAAAADRPVHRRRVERQRLFDLVQELEGVAGLPIHLVDEGDDRNVAQATNFE